MKVWGRKSAAKASIAPSARESWRGTLWPFLRSHPKCRSHAKMNRWVIQAPWLEGSTFRVSWGGRGVNPSPLLLLHQSHQPQCLELLRSNVDPQLLKNPHQICLTLRHAPSPHLIEQGTLVRR